MSDERTDATSDTSDPKALVTRPMASRRPEEHPRGADTPPPAVAVTEGPVADDEPDAPADDVPADEEPAAEVSAAESADEADAPSADESADATGDESADGAGDGSESHADAEGTGGAEDDDPGHDPDGAEDDPDGAEDGAEDVADAAGEAADGARAPEPRDAAPSAAAPSAAAGPTRPTSEAAPAPEAAPAADREPEPEPRQEREEEEEGGPGPETDPADAARRRLLHALVPRPTRSQLLAAVVCAVLGFGVVVQARQTRVASLASLRESELVAVLDNVTQESARLEAQQRSLTDTLEELRTSSDRAPAAREAAEERLRVLGVLAGTLPATGPGIELLVPDVDLKINATELVETVQELRDAGAEAMQVGSVRIVASTSFVDDPGGMKVDGTVLSPPYRFTVIGDPQTLAAALEIPGGVLETFRGKGVEGVVTTKQSLTISALRPSRTPQYARPAPAS